MKMAKAKPNDFKLMHKLHSIMENVFDNQSHPYDIDKELTDEDDEKSLVFEAIKRWWERDSHSWMRVVWGCEMLIENCCDPDGECLEFNPLFAASDDLLEALETAIADSPWSDPSRDGMDDTGPVPVWVQKARAAISQAKREPKSVAT